ncbi:FliM/FliN family flagellar motor switch protein [Cupriavidus sp. 8B]
MKSEFAWEETPLLDIERSAASARPLRWWSTEQLESLASAATAVLRTWQADWGVAMSYASNQLAATPSLAAVRCQPAHELAALSGRYGQSEWSALQVDGQSGGCWWMLESESSMLVQASNVDGASAKTEPSQGLIAALLTALFGGGPAFTMPGTPRKASSPVAEGVADAALSDWWTQLRHWLGALQSAPNAELTNPMCRLDALPVPLLQPWSGTAWLALDWCGHVLHLLVDFARVAHVLGVPSTTSMHRAGTGGGARDEPLTAMYSALNGYTVFVQAELEPVELELGLLAALRPGDVIRLPHSLDAPLLVRTHDGELLCEAFLGKVDAQRAVELLPRHPPRSNSGL